MAKKAPPKKAPAKTSTALARRRSYPGQTLLDAVKIVRGVQVLPAEATSYGHLTDTIELGALGLAEVKLSEKAEAILSEPVNVDDIRVKPDVGGVIYLSHPTYTQWFNRAFGRLGWALVPCAKPSVVDGRLVTCPYLMHIGGKAAAFALGEQEYNPKNTRQTYGDAFEATVASALRRCAKRLGVGLELWDKAFVAQYLHEHCVLVKVRTKDGDIDRAWRRKVDRALPFEVGYDDDHENVRTSSPPRGEEQGWDPHQDARPARGRAQEAPGGAPRGRGVPISDGQVKRFFAILKNSGRNEQVVRDWLTVRYGYKHVPEITRDRYDAICEAVEHSEEKLP